MKRTYGTIVHPDPTADTLESLKQSKAKLLALEYCVARGDPEIDWDDWKANVEYVEALGYYFDYDRECWRLDWEKMK